MRDAVYTNPRHITSIFYHIVCCIFLFFHDHEGYSQVNKITRHCNIGALSLDSGNTDLSLAFNNEINDSIKIVGLGEVSHGGNEPLAFKAKMIQYLIEKRGFRKILIELPYENLEKMNRYLTNGIKDKDSLCYDSLVVGMKASFATQTFIGLFRWIKSYNLEHPGSMVSIYGFDLMQKSGSVLANNILYKYLIPYDKEYAQKLIYKWGNDQSSDSLKLDNMASWFDSRQELLKKVLNRKQYGELLNLRLSIYIASPYTPTPEFTSIFYRDGIMVQNIFYLADTTKSIVWAHDAHIFKADTLLFMGAYLKRHYGNNYYAIITDFSKSATVGFVNTKTDSVTKNKSYYYDQKTFKPAPLSIASRILSNYNISNGVFAYKDIDTSKVGEIFNLIDLFGNEISIVGYNSFDALVIFDSITPISDNYFLGQKKYKIDFKN